MIERNRKKERLGNQELQKGKKVILIGNPEYKKRVIKKETDIIDDGLQWMFKRAQKESIRTLDFIKGVSYLPRTQDEIDSIALKLQTKSIPFKKHNELEASEEQVKALRSPKSFTLPLMATS